MIAHAGLVFGGLGPAALSIALHFAAGVRKTSVFGFPETDSVDVAGNLAVKAKFAVAAGSGARLFG